MKKLLLILLAATLVVGLTFAGGKQEKAAQEEKGPILMKGAFRQKEAQIFNKILDEFEADTGIKVDYQGSAEFETNIVVQAEAGTPPDIAALPQPGLMRTLAEKDLLKPLPQDIIDRIDKNYTKAWKTLGSYKGETYGVFHRVNAKSFVWYPKQEWEKQGYEEPKTWEEMMNLMDQMVEDGYAPWSIGIESGNATGWPATDWMEDIMLRTAGPEMYDKWVNHEIPFTHDAVKNAAEKMGQIWMNDEYVYGGTANIASTNFKEAPKSLFPPEDNKDAKPKALMHRQGNFVTGFFPEYVREDMSKYVGVFGFPQINPEYGTPVLGGGDQFVVFEKEGLSEQRKQNINKVLRFLTTWDACKTWAEAGGALFPHQDQNFDDYASDIESKLAKILVNAEVFRFDGSDNMPSEVGAGSFWEGMSNWVTGVSMDEVLQNIEQSWPEE
jgi:alpha-glucoside transport system substrate-binding protein